MSTIVSPSILAADFANLERDVKMLNSSEADWIHIDIMDGQFVPNISFGLPVMKAIHKHAEKPLDVHLMIETPDDYIEDFKEAGAEILTVHYEVCRHLHRTLQAIKAAGMKTGVAINPHTPVDLLQDVIKDIDVVLIMSVNPGFGGQKFIPSTVDKVRKLKNLIDNKGATTIIEVDGGVNSDNAKSLVDAGASALVAGSFVFKSDDPVQTIKELRNT
ncbi:MAG: ribulose-phosphate 3-epimerase [Fluviicola sp.]|nr:MAG: ribulose-phosphate 3-epimerase [Fluviicola sp.]